MVEAEQLIVTVVLPAVFTLVGAFVILIIGRHMNIWDKTQQKSTFATFNIGTVQKDVDEINKKIEERSNYYDRKIETIMEIFEKKEEVVRAEFRRIWEKLDNLASSMRLVEYRLDRLDRESGAAIAGNRSRTGGGSGRPASPENGAALM